jgi:hypothetical protein
MKKLILSTLALSLVVTATSFADEIKVEGGGTAIATIFRPIKARFENCTATPFP